MADENLEREIYNFLKRVLEWVTAIAGLITALGSFIQLIRGSSSIISALFLVFGASLLWTSLFFIYIKKGNTYTIGFAGGSSPAKKLHAYSPRVRLFAFVGMVLVPLATFTGLGLWKYIQSQPPDKIILLVADFEGPNPKDYRITENIIEQLRIGVKNYPEVQVVALNKSISLQDGTDAARLIGDEYKATVVLWGWYAKTETSVQLSAYFEVLREPKYLRLEHQKRTIKTAVAELQSFNIQLQLSTEINYLTLLTIGLVRYEAKDYDGAIDRLTDALSQSYIPKEIINPGSAYFYRGTAYILKGDFNSAIADYDQVIKFSPDHAGTYFNRAHAYRQKGDYESAQSDYDRVINLKPNDADAYFNRGLTQAQRGNHDSSIADLSKAIDLAPENDSIYLCRGIAYAIKGNYDQAISDHTKAININSADAETYISRGMVFNIKGDHNEAIIDFSKGISLKPNHPYALYHAYLQRGFAYEEIQLYDKAIADFSKAIEFKSDDPDVYFSRGKLYMVKRDYDRAIVDFTKAGTLNPTDPSVYTYRGIVLAQKENYDGAIADFDMAISLKIDDYVAHFNRGVAFKHKGNSREALLSFMKAYRFTPDPKMKQDIERIFKSIGITLR